MDTLKMREVKKFYPLVLPGVAKNSTLVPKNKKMSMTFKISNDFHTKQANQTSFQTKRQHCRDPQCCSSSESFLIEMASGVLKNSLV